MPDACVFWQQIPPKVPGEARLRDALTTRPWVARPWAVGDCQHSEFPDTFDLRLLLDQATEAIRTAMPPR